MIAEDVGARGATLLQLVQGILDDPVEVLVSNHVVAKGEVVIVGGNYGVRILDVTSKAERARSMED